MKSEIQYLKILEKAIKGLEESRTLLCTIDKNEKPNLMAIGWGNIGIIWGKPIFSILLRPSRYTYSLIEETGEFTINIVDDEYKEIVTYCGSISGRQEDKFQNTGLNMLKSKYVKVPIIKESIINFECKVIAKIDLMPEFINEKIRKQVYKSGDYHRIYLGEILNCWYGIDH